MPSRPLPLEQLIGAPLRSLVLGQGIAAQATAEFIAEVGFAPGAGERQPAVRTFDFSYVHPMPDPANPGDVVDTPTRVSVPVLSIVSLPNLRIAEATVAFGADVVEVQQAEARPAELALARKRAAGDRTAIFPRGVDLVAAYSPPAPEGASQPSALSFTIRVVAEPAPEGLTSVLNLLSESIRSRPEGKR